jgi:hypothetical protein
MQFDISQKAVTETAIIELDDANDEPMMVPKLDAQGQQVMETVDGETRPVMVPASVTIYGPGSKIYQRAMSKRNRALVEAVRKGTKRMKDEDQREVDATFLADVTASFNGFGYKDLTGYEMFKAAYMDIKIGFIAEQVNKGLNNWGNFSKRPATT